MLRYPCNDKGSLLPQFRACFEKNLQPKSPTPLPSLLCAAQQILRFRPGLQIYGPRPPARRIKRVLCWIHAPIDCLLTMVSHGLVQKASFFCRCHDHDMTWHLMQTGRRPRPPAVAVACNGYMYICQLCHCHQSSIGAPASVGSSSWAR